MFCTGRSEKERALGLLATWGKAGNSDKALEAKAEPETLAEIAKLYREMNLHPRAFDVVKEYSVVLGDRAESLRRQYSKEWLALVESYCVGVVEKCTLFGENVLPRNNRLAIHIPPPCSRAALEQVARSLRGVGIE